MALKALVLRNSSNLLDPKVSFGNDLIPNILRHLGANDGITKNPSAIYLLTGAIKKIALQCDIDMSEEKI